MLGASHVNDNNTHPGLSVYGAQERVRKSQASGTSTNGQGKQK